MTPSLGEKCLTCCGTGRIGEVGCHCFVCDASGFIRFDGKGYDLPQDARDAFALLVGFMRGQKVAARAEAWQEALDAVRFKTINQYGMAMDYDGTYHVDHPESVVSAIVRNLRNGDGTWKFGPGPAERRP